VIGLPPGVRVLVATKPVDFRKGADTLAAAGQGGAETGSLRWTVFGVPRQAGGPDQDFGVGWALGSAFTGRLWTRVRSSGPPISDGVMRLSPAQLSALR